MRAVSCGSSASAVPIPTTTASRSARQWCARTRESSPEIHFESPVWVATLPSSVIADLKRTCGRPVRACLRKAWLRQRRARGELAVGDDDLDALVAQDARARGRRPSRSGRRRRRRRAPMPASRIASVHGGVWPWWQQGSSETYSVAPREVGVAAGRERLALGVRAAVDGVPALAQRRAVAGRPPRRPAGWGSRARDPAPRARSRGRGGVVGLQQRGHVRHRGYFTDRGRPRRSGGR